MSYNSQVNIVEANSPTVTFGELANGYFFRKPTKNDLLMKISSQSYFNFTEGKIANLHSLAAVVTAMDVTINVRWRNADSEGV